ncbi:MAG: cobalt ECF transporter T component CbiQ [Candidatus Omnitrophota bacterium]
MHHAFLDNLSHIESPFNKIPIEFKLIGLFVFILLIVFTPIRFIWAYILYFGIIIGLLLLSRVPIKFIFKRLALILPFILLLLVSIPFIQKEQRLLIFSRCLIRSLLCCLSIIVVFSTAKFSRVLGGLRKFHVPELFVMILGFMYRYIFVLEDQIERTHRAWHARSLADRRNWFLNKTFVQTLGVLFIRTYERAERVYLAMRSRGFNGQEHN